MSAQSATKAGVVDVVSLDPVRILHCCECGKPHTQSYGRWEHGNASACSKACNTAKETKEKVRPHYWPDGAKAQLVMV